MRAITKFVGVCALAVAGAACHVDLADAATIRGNDLNCQALGETFTDIAVFRAKGMDWSTAKVRLQAAIAESKLDVDGLVRDADDEAFVMSAAWSVWNGALALLNPVDVGVAVYLECVGQLKQQRKTRVQV